MSLAFIVLVRHLVMREKILAAHALIFFSAAWARALDVMRVKLDVTAKLFARNVRARALRRRLDRFTRALTRLPESFMISLL